MRPSSARTMRASLTSPRQHRLCHVREQDALGADAVELFGDFLPTHVEARRSLEVETFHDEEIGPASGWNERVGPLRVAAEVQHLAFELEAQRIGRRPARVLHLEWGHPYRADMHRLLARHLKVA